MFYLAQMFLPPWRIVTVDFMGKILKGKKKAFRNWEVIPVRVPFKNRITMKFVNSKITDVASIQSYLPDEPATHCTREYIFTIVNTFDP